MSIWYRTGTASIANGTTAVNGTGTAWAAQVKEGDGITFDGGGKFYEVASVTDNTHLALATPFGEATVVNGVYAIDRRSPKWALASDLAVRIGELLATSTDVLSGSGPPSPALGSDGSLYLDVDANVLYGPKAGGAWGTGFSLGGFTPRGTYSALTSYEFNDLVLFQGSTWRAKTNTIGNDPPTLPATSNTWWELFAQRGNPGTDGANGAGANPDLLINPDGRIDQRNKGAVATTADDAYGGPDRWYSLTQTASIQVQRLTDGEDGMPFYQRLTQNQATPQRMGRAQIVESHNCKHARNRNVVLSGRFRCSGSQAIRYAILGWTGAADVVNSDVVNDWASGSYTPGGFFLGASLSVIALGSITPAANAWTDLTAIGGVVGSTVNNLIAFIWTEGTAAQNVTLDFRMKLEVGATATAFVPRMIAEEQTLCFRYFFDTGAFAGSLTIRVYNMSGVSFPTPVTYPFPVPMRATPLVTATGDVNDGPDFTTWDGGTSTAVATSQIKVVPGGQHLDLNRVVASAEL